MPEYLLDKTAGFLPCFFDPDNFGIVNIEVIGKFLGHGAY
jgi:hypothetical protein